MWRVACYNEDMPKQIDRAKNYQEHVVRQYWKYESDQGLADRFETTAGVIRGIRRRLGLIRGTGKHKTEYAR